MYALLIPDNFGHLATLRAATTLRDGRLGHLAADGTSETSSPRPGSLCFFAHGLRARAGALGNASALGPESRLLWSLRSEAYASRAGRCRLRHFHGDHNLTVAAKRARASARRGRPSHSAIAPSTRTPKAPRPVSPPSTTLSVLTHPWRPRSARRGAWGACPHQRSKASPVTSAHRWASGATNTAGRIRNLAVFCDGAPLAPRRP